MVPPAGPTDGSRTVRPELCGCGPNVATWLTQGASADATRLYDGEKRVETVSVGDTRLVVTTHRLLVRPDGGPRPVAPSTGPTSTPSGSGPGARGATAGWSSSGAWSACSCSGPGRSSRSARSSGRSSSRRVPGSRAYSRRPRRSSGCSPCSTRRFSSAAWWRSPGRASGSLRTSGAGLAHWRSPSPGPTQSDCPSPGAIARLSASGTCWPRSPAVTGSCVAHPPEPMGHHPVDPDDLG
jgi:hypothetical protein